MRQGRETTNTNINAINIECDLVNENYTAHLSSDGTLNANLIQFYILFLQTQLL